MSLDLTLRALGDPTRREILRALRDEGDLSAGDIAGRFPITAASISHHLNVLREAGLVQSERQGRSIVYALDTTVFHDAVEQLMRLLDVGGRK